MIEAGTVEKWIRSVLGADATIAAAVGTRIYPRQAPQNAARPFLIYALISGEDINTFGARALAQPLFLIKAVGEVGNPAPLRSAANQADTLFQDRQVTLDGLRIRCKRQSEVSEPENVNGIQYWHLGGLYRMYSSPINS